VREEPAGDGASRRATKESQDLRGRFLDRLRKAGEIALVSDETAADGRLEIMEAAVHHQPRVETVTKRGPEPHRKVLETQEEFGAAASDEPDYALIVRLTTASRFAEFTSGTREPSASSAADTVVRAMGRWIRAHRGEFARRP
jgi:hypothetical protein